MENKVLKNDELEQIIRNVKATMEMEGLEMNKETEELGRRVLNGKLTGDRAIEIIKAKYTNSINYDEPKEAIKGREFEREEPYL